MNQVLAGTTALILALVLWGLGKKPRTALASKTDQGLLGVTNHQNPALVLNNSSNTRNNQKNSNLELEWQPPKTIQEKILIRQKLKHLINGCPEERLQAIIIADLWGNKTVLPILRRGLKDADSKVVKASAKALEKYKGVSSNQQPHESEARRPPRNVALMR